MSRKWIFIQPQDVWMFRDSKPFAAGQSFVARSGFPPNPQTVQGIIRTHVIEQSGVDWGDFGNRRDESLMNRIGAPATREGHLAVLGDFAIRGPFVGRRTGNGIELLVPTPLDVMRNKENADQFAILKPSPADFDTQTPFEGWQPLALSEKGEYDLAGGWLDEENFMRYLEGHAPQQVLGSEKVFLYDERVGLAIDYGRRASREQHLYHAEFVSPREEVGLLVEVAADLLPNRGYIGSGGESRSAYYETVDFQWPVPSKVGRLKIVVMTAAYFSAGWQPYQGDWSLWVGQDARLVSMAVGRPTLISGWDTVRKQPKALHHYVPVGSVYYFDNAHMLQSAFTEPIPDHDFEHGVIDAARFGFGGFAVGSW